MFYRHLLRRQTQSSHRDKDSLVSLAIAEKEGFTVSDDVIPDYFVEGTDIDALKEEYGVAYLKHMILCDMVMEHVVSQYIN